MENKTNFFSNKIFLYASIPAFILACLYAFSTVHFIIYTLTDGRSFYENANLDMMSALFSSTIITLGYLLIYAVLGAGFFLLFKFSNNEKSIKIPILLVKIVSIYSAIFIVFNMIMSIIVSFLNTLQNNINNPNATSTFSVSPIAIVEVVVGALFFVLLFKFISIIEQNTYNNTICILFVAISALCVVFDLPALFTNSLSLYFLILYVSKIALYVFFTIIGIKYKKQIKKEN